MAKTVNDPGTLNWLVLEIYVKRTLGENLFNEPHASTYRISAITKTLNRIKQKLKKTSDDPVLTEIIFATKAETDLLLLKDAIGAFLTDRSSHDFPDLLKRIIAREYSSISSERISRVVELYINILIEELPRLDAAFSEGALSAWETEKWRPVVVDSTKEVETLVDKTEQSKHEVTLHEVVRFIQVGMLTEGLQRFHSVLHAVSSNPKLLDDETFRSRFTEADNLLDRVIRGQIEKIEQIRTYASSQEALAYAIKLIRDLDNGSAHEYFLLDFRRLERLADQLHKDVQMEEKYTEIRRLVDRNQLQAALEQLSLLREEVDPQTRISAEIESLFDQLRGITNIVLTPVQRETLSAMPQPLLTTRYLDEELAPFLKAIAQIQRLLDEISGREVTDISIRVISQNSPVGVSLEGVSDTFVAVTDIVIPWKRNHAERMAEFARREKQYEIQKKRIEIQEGNLQLLKSTQEIEKCNVEIAKMRQEEEKLRIENERARLSLERAKIQLALEILSAVAPNLSETDKLSAIVKLLPVLDKMIASNIEITKKM